MTLDPVLLLVIPLVAAFLTPLASLLSRRISHYVPLMGITGMAVVMALQLGDLQHGAVTSTTGGFEPPYGISIVMTPLGGLLGAAMIFVALFVVLSDLGSYDRKYRTVNDTMVMMATAGALGMVITGDLFNLFVFLEITSIAGVVLAALPRKGDDQGLNWRGAAVYAVVGSVASFIVLAGIAILYGATSTLNIAQMAERVSDIDTFVAGAAFLALLIGFGIESELFPLNGWAPEVYRGSRWGTASLFSTVIGKAGLLALFRISFIVLGPALQGDIAAGILLWGGLATYLFGEAAAFTSRDLYRMLGYSSIGMFGLLTASFSMGSADGVRAGTMLIIGHMLAKPILFSILGHMGNGKDIPLKALRGLSTSSGTAGFLMTVGVLALIGMPPSPIFWGKFLFFSGAQGQWVVIALVAFGTILEAGYLGRILVNIHGTGDPVVQRISVFRGIMGVIAVLIMVAIGVFPSSIQGMMDLVVEEFTDITAYTGWGVI